MKNLARFTVSCLLVMAILVLSLPLTPNYAAASSQTGQQNNQKAPKAKSGPEVAARVRALNESRRDVRAALKVFENKGHKPKIEDSSALTGLHTSTRNVARATGNMNGSPFQRASFVQQSSDEYIELIWVPTLSINYEWQGTAIGTLYDSSGNIIDQYVADIVMVMPDHNVYQWDVVYELPFRDGVALDPIDEPGMYTSFDLGTPTNLQQLDSGQVSRANRTKPHGGAHFVKARWRGGWRSWAKCTAAWCGGAILGSLATCLIINLWNAEVAFGPCVGAGVGIGCITAAVGCSYGTLWD